MSKQDREAEPRFSTGPGAGAGARGGFGGGMGGYGGGYGGAAGGGGRQLYVSNVCPLTEFRSGVSSSG